ncbi:Hypothetical predicted protein, partial [Podarcis lilfordi]
QFGCFSVPVILATPAAMSVPENMRTSASEEDKEEKIHTLEARPKNVTANDF